MQKRNTYGFWYGFNLTALLLIPSFFFLVPLLQAFEQFVQSVDIELNQKAVTRVGEKTEVHVQISNVNSSPLNAVEFEINYDTKALVVTEITQTGTLCEDRFLLTNTINHASGTAVFQCGTISPFSKTKGTVATLHIIPLQSGTSSISFGSTTTHILAHDGFGTDATKSRLNLVFTAL